MPESPPGRSLEARLQDVDFVERALKRGVRQALLLHKQTGRPIVVWRDGQVVWIAPEDIEIEPE